MNRPRDTFGRFIGTRKKYSNCTVCSEKVAKSNTSGYCGSCVKQGRRQTDASRVKKSKALIGHPYWGLKQQSEATRLKIGNALRGRKQSEEHRMKNSGALSPAWRGGITPETRKLRNSSRYKEWRRHVYQRDDYTCQACGERGGKLNADHELPWSLYPALRFEILNGRTLCETCHVRIGWRPFSTTYSHPPNILGL